MKLEDCPVIMDDFVEPDAFEEIVDLLHQGSWKFGWKSNVAGESFLHWHRHLAGGTKSSRTSCDDELAGAPELDSIHRLWSEIKDRLLPGHVLVRCYANAHTFGLEGSIHRDNPPGDEMVTTMLYAHRLWPVPWGGETVFYSEGCDSIVASIMPKPRRLTIFRGCIQHMARAPSRQCREMRVTLVFKSMRAQ